MVEPDLDAERCPATTGRFSVGIVENETLSIEPAGVLKAGASKKDVRFSVDIQFYAVLFDDFVVVERLVHQIKRVCHTGASAALDSDAEVRAGFACLFGEDFYVVGGILCDGDGQRLRHRLVHTVLYVDLYCTLAKIGLSINPILQTKHISVNQTNTQHVRYSGLQGVKPEPVSGE